jgi:hypothetical protein
MLFYTRRRLLHVYPQGFLHNFLDGASRYGELSSMGFFCSRTKDRVAVARILSQKQDQRQPAYRAQDIINHIADT